MIINPEIANRFINQYKNFLLYTYREKLMGEENVELLEKLIKARDYFNDNREALNSYTNKKNIYIDSEIIDVIKDIHIDLWVYLRDTTKYSIFINPAQKQSLAVVGLTDRVRNYLGFSGAFLKTGIFRVRNTYVCDGLISNVLQMGKNYKAEFNEAHKQYKAEGRFYR